MSARERSQGIADLRGCNEALAQQMDLLKIREHQLKGGYYA